MKKIIILTEQQLKKVVQTLAEEKMPKKIHFKSPFEEVIPPEDQELLNKAVRWYGFKSPYMLYKALQKDMEAADVMGSLKGLEISEIIGVLDYYWKFNLPTMYNSPKKQDVPQEPEEPVVKPEKTPKFGDRFKFKMSDMVKFRDE